VSFFNSAVDFAKPRDVAVADMNGDGKMDLVVGTNPKGVGVLLNDGSATVVGAPTWTAPAGGAFASGLAVADLDADGDPDVVLSEFDTNRFGVYRNTGSGGLAAPVLYSSAAGGLQQGLAVGDFDGDAAPDVAVVYRSNGFVGIYLGDGAGAFTESDAFSTGFAVAGFVSAADFDADGVLDLAVQVQGASNPTTATAVLIGDGAGGFAPAVTAPAAANPTDVRAVDFTGDGLPDLLSPSSNSPGGVQVAVNTTTTVATFTVTGPATSAAGQAIGITVTARLPGGAVFTDYRGTVNLTSSDAAALGVPATYRFTAADNGVRVFTVTLVTPGAQTVTATDRVRPAVTGSHAVTVIQTLAAITPFGGGGQLATVGATFALPLAARVTDGAGNPVAGRTVTFTAPASGPSAFFPNGATAVTDANGVARVTVRAGAVIGAFSVSATVAGLAGAAVFPLTVTPAGGAGRPLVGPFAVGAGPGGPTAVTVYAPDRTPVFTQDVFEGGFVGDLPGGVRVAVADVTGDGVPDLIAGAGPGGAPRVAVYDGLTRTRLVEFGAFEAGFTGGVYVAAADFDGDGRAEVVVTPDEGGGPVVAVFDGAGVAAGRVVERVRYYGIQDDAFRGGARAAVGDVTGDGVPDVVVSAGFLGGPRISIWDGTTVAAGTKPTTPLANFFAFEDTLRNGTFVAAGDVTGDGKADLILGGGPGGGPRVRIADAAKLLAAGNFGSLDARLDLGVANFFSGDDSDRGGVRLAVADLDGDARADILTGDGPGGGSEVRGFLGTTVSQAAPPEALGFDPFPPAFRGGVFVG
jgi:hypothetical protein